MTPEARALKDLIDEAREVMIQLREAMAPIVHQPRFPNHMTRGELAIVRCLSDGRVHSKEQIRYRLDIVMRRTDDPGNLKSVDVMVCHLRKKLDDLGIAIETDWGNGYFMSAASIEALRALELPVQQATD